MNSPAPRQAADLPRLRHLWLLLGWLWLALVIYASLRPQAPFGGYAHLDKVGHASAYLLLMWWLAQLFTPGRRLQLLAGLFMLGLSLECLQAFQPLRYFDVLDLLANSGGLLLGWALMFTPLARGFSWFEAHIMSPRK